MKGKRIRIVVEVNTDAVPGWGSNPEDYVNLIRRYLDERIGHYNPKVYLDRVGIPEIILDGKMVTEKELAELLNELQERRIDAEEKIREEFGVSHETASAIFYLRTRSRWTQGKELELINRDRAGEPVSLGTVLSGDF